MKKKYRLFLFIIMLVIIAVFAVSCRRQPINGGNPIVSPILDSVSVTRKNSTYKDTENTLCLMLDGAVCEPVIITLQFTNQSNLDIYSVQINSIDYDKASFLSGHTPNKVQIEVNPLFKSAGNYSFEITEINYSTGTNIKTIQDLEPVSVPVRVAPNFQVTLDMTQAECAPEEQIETVNEVDFMSNLVFLSGNYAMNTVAPEGYGFVGWFTDPEPDISKDKKYSSMDSYEFYTEKTFYAIYECLYTYVADAATGTTTITGLTDTGKEETELYLPDSLGGYSVKYIGQRAFEGSIFTYIECNPSLIVIKNRAFKDCGALRGIFLNDGLVEIESLAFSGCTRIDRMPRFPSSLTTLGIKAFEYCGWTTYKMDETNRDFEDTLFLPNTLLNIGDSCFQYSTFKKVYFEDYGEAAPTEVAFGMALFYRSYAIETVWTSAIYTGDHNNPFNKGANGIRRIPSQCFQYCNALDEVALSEGLQEIGTEAFMCVAGNMKNFTSVTLPDSLVSIASYAFANVPIASLNFRSQEGSSLITIGDYAFQVSNLSGRLDLYTPNLMNYGKSPFWGSIDITSIFLHTDYAPYFKASNTNTVQNLNPAIKYYVPKAKLGQYENEWQVVFDIYGLGTTYTPLIHAMEDITDDGKYSYKIETYDGDTFITLTNIFSVAGDSVIIEDTLTINGYPNPLPIKKIGSMVAGKDVVSVKFDNPNNIIEIKADAFNGCNSLAEFCSNASGQTGSKFEDFGSLVTIGDNAFYGTALTRFVAHASLKKIGNAAFCNSNLNFVMISGSYTGENSMFIDVNAFEYCDSLDTVVLGDRVKTIGSNAFAYCGALGTFVMEHTEFPSFARGSLSSIGILGNNNTVTTIYATAQLIAYKNTIQNGGNDIT
ncbi:MAG: leucine-rich repeat domain-containing protein, partial [Clostridia bacterium]|nr:leucine-rich repeat domain-containing protein [Clostridia bacterium]